jgi:hypothetical protein
MIIRTYIAIARHPSARINGSRAPLINCAVCAVERVPSKVAELEVGEKA